MNLISKSKRQLIKYIRLLRKNLKWSQEAFNELLYDHEELKNLLQRTEYELGREEEHWHNRLREAEKMYELKTYGLKHHNEALTKMLIHSAELSLSPPIIINPYLQKELDEEHKRNTCLNDALRQIQTILTNCD